MTSSLLSVMVKTDVLPTRARAHILVASEIIVMLQGRIVAQGSKGEILAPSHHDYTQLLLSSVSEMDTDWLSNVLESRKAGHLQGARATNRNNSWVGIFT